ncbi:MAG: MoaD/ThiS family protein [Anaerolineales bacterium]|jgi:molybdopterin synthase sulfur carrier subunit
MEVNFYATLRRVVGAKSVEFDLDAGATIAQLLEEMLLRYPALRHELFDEQGQLYQHVHIFVNGRDVSFLQLGMDTPLSERDAIGVFPAVGGG